MSTVILKLCTVPCTDAGRAIYQLGELPDDGVYKAMMHLQHQKNGTEFLPLNQHKIAAIALLTIDGEKVSSQVIGDAASSESDLLTELATQLASADEVICWTGAEFDLPVIGYRFLKYGIACPAFWNKDSFEAESMETLNLSDVLSGFSPGAEASFDELVQLLGLASGKGLSALDVLEEYLGGNIQALRQACEIDVANIYRIYLKYQKTCGDISDAEYLELNHQFKQQLISSDLPHLKQFAAAS